MSIRAILESLHPRIDFHTHTRLIDDEVLKSFDIISIIAEVSDKMDIDIPVEEIIPENFNSCQALEKLLERLEEEG